MEPETVTYYGAAGLLSSEGLRPFDAERSGTVLGEGAGALVLETLDSARARGAVIHGEVLGSGITSEACGILAVRDDGEALGRAFGAETVPVTGFKWCLGHTIAASGVIESILTLLCLRDGTVPGIPTLRHRAHECRAAGVSTAARTPRSSTGLVISRGFAGLNSCVVLSAPSE